MNREGLALSLFFVSYFLQGMALVDLAKLRWKDIKPLNRMDSNDYYRKVLLGGYHNAEMEKVSNLYYEIEILRSKTSKPTRVIVDGVVLFTTIAPFVPAVDEYDENNYIFGIYEKDCEDEKIKFSRVIYMIYLVNANLKRVAKKNKYK